jgi:hypothetical protein
MASRKSSANWSSEDNAAMVPAKEVTTFVEGRSIPGVAPAGL